MIYEGGKSDLALHLAFVSQMIDYVLGQFELSFQKKKYDKNMCCTFIRNLAHDLVLKGS